MSKKTITLTVIVVAIITLAGWYLYGASNAKQSVEFAVAKTGTLVQEVSVSGRVKPAESVNLSFEKNGRIRSVSAAVGGKVSLGQILAQLDDAETRSQINQAEADLNIQKIKLEEILKGTRSEEIKIYETKLESARTAMSESVKNVADKIKDGYTKTDDAIRNKTDQFFSNPSTNNPLLSLTINDSQLKINLETARVQMEKNLAAWKESIKAVDFEQQIEGKISEGKKNLAEAKTFLDNVTAAVNGLQVSYSLSQTTIDGYKTDASTARANVNTAITAVVVAEEKYSSAKTAVTESENELMLKKAGPTNEQINSQQAQIKSSEANLENFKVQLEKLALRSPIYGTVSRQDAKVGEFASANSPLVTINSDSAFKMEANVPEADIAKIKIGNSAKVTLDAYGDSVIFEASVAAIDPAETIIDGVPTYKTTLHFKNKDERVKSGMTANMDILTDKKDDATYIPQRAVITKNGNKNVKILINEKTGETKEIDIKTGIRDSGGNIEIIAGLKAGDKVALSQ